MKNAYVLLLMVFLMVSCSKASNNKDDEKTLDNFLQSSFSGSADEKSLNNYMSKLSQMTFDSVSSLDAASHMINASFLSYKESGLVQTFEVEKNAIFIDMKVWSILTDKEKKEFAYCSALYCGLHRNITLYWVVIKDFSNQIPVAKYVHNRSFVEI
jgi:hypothetical protein